MISDSDECSAEKLIGEGDTVYVGTETAVLDRVAREGCIKITFE